MATLREWLHRLWGSIARSRNDRDLEEELRTHLDFAGEDERQRGTRPENDLRAARLEAGAVLQAIEALRDRRGLPWLEELIRDIRFGFRQLVRSPALSLFTGASLALGIGSTVAIFALFDRIVLRQLPVPHPQQLIVASFGGPGGNFNYSLPYPQFEAIRRHNTTLAGVFAWAPFGRATVSSRGESGIAEGIRVTGDYYRVLGLAPAVGRLIEPSDDRPGGTVAVLSHSYWQGRFGGRSDIIGTAVTLNGMPFTIVGVEPAGFFGAEVGRPYDISVPMRTRDAFSIRDALWNRAFATWIYVMGRLKPDVTLAQAEAELRPIFMRVGIDAAQNPNQARLAREHQLRLESGATGAHSDLRDGHERWLRLLLIVLGAVLLLAGLNVATLLLARSSARQRELSTRLALGAGRMRIVRQLLTETTILTMIGGISGFLLGLWGSQFLLRMAAPAHERLPVALTPTLRLVAFTIAVSAVTCVIIGLLPAIRATWPRRLVIGRQVGGGPRRRAVDRVLVGTQVALSLVLLVAAGLFLRSLGQLWAQETGYDRRNILMLSVDAQLAGYKSDEILFTYQRILDSLRAVPGVRSVTASAVRPVSDSYYFIDSVSQVGSKVFPGDQRIRVAFNSVAPGYFATLGIPLVAGRDFDHRDIRDAPPVVIVSERMARHFSGNPVGQRLGSGRNAREVIGVAKDIRYARIKDEPREVLYFPLFQAEPTELWYTPTFEIRFAGGVSAVVSLVREAVGRVDSRLQMFRVRTLEEQTQDSLSRERLLALMTSYFGAFAVVLACIGLYGLTSYTVTHRSSEVGLRIALGAEPKTVRGMFVRDAAATVAAGTLVGMVGTLGVERLVRTQLFGIQPHDPVTLTGATALLLLTALPAAYLAARRSSSIDPLIVLRQD